MIHEDPHINAYLDRSMDPETMAAFSARLAEEPDLAKQFIEAVRFDVALRDQYRGALEVDGLLELEEDDLLADLGTDPIPGTSHLKDLLAMEASADTVPPVDITDSIRARQSRQRKLDRREAAMRARYREQHRVGEGSIRVLSWGLLAAAVALLMLLTVWLTAGRNPSSSPPTAGQQPTAPGPGAPADSVDTGVVLSLRSTAGWANAESLPTRLPGVSLASGTYRLESGVAELVYPSGAVVTVLAPAELVLTNRNGMMVHRGRVLCESPAGSGAFQLDTERGRFSSVGARLGIQVEPQRVGSYVFAGSVEFQSDQRRVGLGRSDLLVSVGDQPVTIRADAPVPNDLPQDFEGFASFAERRQLVVEPFEDDRAIERFVVGQGYVTDGSTPGSARVRSGRLLLEPGGNNTVCCYMQPEGRALPTGTRWQVELSPLSNVGGDDLYTLFLAISTGAAQPGPADPENPMRNGSRGFRLRWDVKDNGIRIEHDGAPPGGDASYDLICEGVPAGLAIGRISRSRFAFWVRFEGEAQWRLIGERTHTGLDEDLPLSVGVEAFSYYRGRTFGFDNLRLESIPD